ncbi:uncharacterized protein DDB_G0271670-like [Mya arenaria]|uniref:uncharacterized protein DDB_G0271670-like n=1 Tax=Mya arenaria TaxID=6604 RepID=UPI0022E2822D|nr:uncharacterized protein DDB_G0271670-like [Mya arenaria]
MGNLVSGLSSGECAQTTSEPNPWWQAGLDTGYYVTSVSVTSSPECKRCSEDLTLRNLLVEVGHVTVSFQDSTWEGEFAANHQTCVFVPGTVPHDTTVNLTCTAPIYGNYVRVTLLSGSDNATLSVCNPTVLGQQSLCEDSYTTSVVTPSGTLTSSSSIATASPSTSELSISNTASLSTASELTSTLNVHGTLVSSSSTASSTPALFSWISSRYPITTTEPSTSQIQSIEITSASGFSMPKAATTCTSSYSMAIAATTFTSSYSMPFAATTSSSSYSMPKAVTTSASSNSMPIAASTSTSSYSMPKAATMSASSYSMPIAATTSTSSYSMPKAVATSTSNYSMQKAVTTSTSSYSMPKAVTTSTSSYSMPKAETTSTSSHSMPKDVTTSTSSYSMPIAATTSTSSYSMPIAVTTSTSSYSMPKAVTTSTSSYSMPKAVTTSASGYSIPKAVTTMPVWCPCSCKQYWLIRNLTSTNKTTDQVGLELEQSLKEMTVKRTETIIAKRKLVSVEDQRTSARVVGTVGMAFFIAVISLLVLSDLPVLVGIVKRMFRYFRSHRKQLSPPVTRK